MNYLNKIEKRALKHAEEAIAIIDESQRETVVKAISDDFKAGAEAMAKIIYNEICPADAYKIKIKLKNYLKEVRHGKTRA